MAVITLAEVKARTVEGTRIRVLSHRGRPERIGDIRTVKATSADGYVSGVLVPEMAGTVDVRSAWPPAESFRGLGPDTWEYETAHPTHPGTVRLAFVTDGAVNGIEIDSDLGCGSCPHIGESVDELLLHVRSVHEPWLLDRS